MLEGPRNEPVQRGARTGICTPKPFECRDPGPPSGHFATRCFRAIINRFARRGYTMAVWNRLFRGLMSSAGDRNNQSQIHEGRDQPNPPGHEDTSGGTGNVSAPSKPPASSQEMGPVRVYDLRSDQEKRIGQKVASNEISDDVDKIVDKIFS